jgi:2-C-methyl-D-erythritol 4-phosphate cytidylyltransferase
VIAAPPDWEEPSILVAEEIAATKVSSAVTGGESRSESVRLALEEVPADAAVVLVHDAAARCSRGGDRARAGAAVRGLGRRRAGRAARRHGQAVEGDRVVETLPRDDLVAVQTPQAFWPTRSAAR